jgi:hypothetical protein
MFPLAIFSSGWIVSRSVPVACQEYIQPNKGFYNASEDSFLLERRQELP